MNPPLATAPARDDRLLPITRVVAACIVPFLLAAFFVLYVRPELSGERFAWNVQPRFTAYWIGSGYLGGAWFFLRVITAPRWHQVTLGLPAIWAFVCVMLAATLLHWSDSTQGASRSRSGSRCT